jgi:hypothetical protein
MNTRQRFTIALTLMAFVLSVIETTTRTSLGLVTPSGKTDPHRQVVRFCD